jgi:hypothetical protein
MAAIIAMLVTTFFVAGSPQTSYANPVVDAPMTAFDPVCAYECTDCDWDGGPLDLDGHELEESGPEDIPDASAEHEEECNGPKNCSEVHDCGVNRFASVEGMNPVWVASRMNDAEHLAMLLQEYPKEIRYNESRQAVQVFGCNETVLASLPVSETVATHLLDLN